MFYLLRLLTLSKLEKKKHFIILKLLTKTSVQYLKLYMSHKIAKRFRQLYVIGCITINIRIFMLTKLVKLFSNIKGHFRKAAEI